MKTNPVMNAARREEILAAYARHSRRFDEIASRPYHPTGLFAQDIPADKADLNSDHDPRPELDPLSRREQQVLFLVARGHSNREIGSRLHITEETVKTHVRRILRRLNAHNRAHAVHLAHELGQLDRT